MNSAAPPSRPMPIPEEPFIGVFGAHAQGWRQGALRQLEEAGVPHFESTHPGWQGIDEANGASRQAEIDALVAWQRRAIEASTCVVVHLSGDARATRYELGLFDGLGKRVFAHVEPGTVGAHYLLAAFRLAPSTSVHGSVQEATAAAIAWMQAGGYLPAPK